MKHKIAFLKVLGIAITALFMANDSIAQTSDNPDLAKQISAMTLGDSHFMVVGLTTFGFVNQTTTNTMAGMKTTDKINSIGDADRFEFSPMFLWRHGDNMLIEFEPSWDGNQNGQLGVNWADISYYAAPGLIVRGGYIVLPFGIYTKRLAAGWINKVASDPIGVDAAGTDFGVEIEGGFPLGKMKGSYDIALSNGFQLNPDGTIGNVGIQAINNGKTVTGRLAILPFSNSCLELGVSGLMGSLATPIGDTNVYKNPMVNMYAVDLNFVKNVHPFQINVKGQYNISSVNNQNYYNPDSMQTKYTFTNTMTSYFAQASIRPTQSKNKILKKLELAYRHSYNQTPAKSTFGQDYSEDDISLNYWMSWRTVLKLTFESVKLDGTSTQYFTNGVTSTMGTTNINRMIIQFSTEF